MKWLVVLLGISIVATLATCSAQSGNPTLQVVGEGKVTVSADMVTIAATAESNDANITVAQAAASEILNRTKDALLSAGIDQKAMSSSQGSGVSSFESSSKVCRTVNNNTTCETSSQSAKKVSKTLLVRLKTADESRINSVLNAAKSAGASAEVLEYGLSDPSDAVASAHKAAISDAKKNAEDIATAAGGRLGKVVEISEYSSPYVSPSEQPGMVDVTSVVLATYEIT